MTAVWAPLQQLNMPGMYLHPLKGARKGKWAVSVSGNRRIAFDFDGEDAAATISIAIILE